MSSLEDFLLFGSPFPQEEQALETFQRKFSTEKFRKQAIKKAKIEQEEKTKELAKNIRDIKDEVENMLPNFDNRDELITYYKKLWNLSLRPLVQAYQLLLSSQIALIPKDAAVFPRDIGKKQREDERVQKIIKEKDEQLEKLKEENTLLKINWTDTAANSSFYQQQWDGCLKYINKLKDETDRLHKQIEDLTNQAFRYDPNIFFNECIGGIDLSADFKDIVIPSPVCVQTGSIGPFSSPVKLEIKEDIKEEKQEVLVDPESPSVGNYDKLAENSMKLDNFLNASF